MVHGLFAAQCAHCADPLRDVERVGGSTTVTFSVAV